MLRADDVPVLAENQQVRERRDQLRHPHYQAPELLASGPNRVWSWDITRLLGPTKWTYFYLYVILDIFSRYVVGWMLAYRESANLAKKLIEQSIKREEIEAGRSTVHADRGASMTSKPVAFLLAGLGVTKTHSRPHVSNDNPYSESQFKTMKYRPEFPERFGSYQDAHRFSRVFSLVQSRASSQWLGLLYAVRGALWVSRKAAGSTQRSAQGSLRKKLPAFCAGCAKPRTITDCGVDQQAQRIAFKRWAGTKFADDWHRAEKRLR